VIKLELLGVDCVREGGRACDINIPIESACVCFVAVVRVVQAFASMSVLRKSRYSVKGVKGGRCDQDGTRTNRGLCVCKVLVSVCTRLKTCLFLLLCLHAACRVDLLFLFLERRPGCSHASMLAVMSPHHHRQSRRRRITSTAGRRHGRLSLRRQGLSAV